MVDADNKAFVGAAAANTAQLALNLANGDSALLKKLSVAPGVEIRSNKSLTLASDWNLAPTTATRVGAAPVITLRAAGQLTLSNSLSDGFGPTAAAADKRAITAGSLVLPGSAASFRLIGGADLAGADPLSVLAAGNGNAVNGSPAGITVGRVANSNTAVPPVVFIRSSTGNIDLAAAGDINLGTALDANGRKSQVRIYTTGTAVAAAETPGFETLGIRTDTQLIRGSSGTLGPFFEDAGNISLSAGADVRGLPAAIYSTNANAEKVQYVSDWWFRQTNTTKADQGVALWSRYDLFAQGIASFGGGDISVRAGRDVIDLDVSTPSSGYAVQATGTPGTAAYKAAQQRWFSGGSLAVQAGRDVVGGLFNAGGAQASLSAGDQIRAATKDEAQAQPLSYPGPQLFYMDTAWTVSASNGLQIGSLVNPASMSGAKQGGEQSARVDAVFGLSGKSAAQILSAAGDVGLSNSRPANAQSGSSPGAAADVVPDELLLAAPGGSIKSAALMQQAIVATSLAVVAGKSVTVESFKVTAAAGESPWPKPQAQATLNELFDVYAGHWLRTDAGLDASSRSPVHIVAGAGDLTLGSLASFSARPLRLVAGGDLNAAGPIQLQHNSAAEMSLLQAGRDIKLGQQEGIRQGGPGDLLLIAGRDVDMNRGTGINTVGNLDNGLLLGKGGANITVLAGVQLQDSSQAVAKQFQLVGAGLEFYPAELAVQLKALADRGLVLPPADAAAAAKAFAALPLAEQREQVRALVGDALLSSSTEAFLQRSVAQAEANSLASAQALAAGRIGSAGLAADAKVVPGSELWNGAPQVLGAKATAEDLAAATEASRLRLRDGLQAAALGAALAAKVQSLSAAQQQALTLAVSPYTTALTDFVNQGRVAKLDGAAAAEAFKGMDRAQQTLFLSQVLATELRSAGRAALTGSHLAYLRGYQALDSLFPPSSAAAAASAAHADGNILLSNSQIKTSQGGHIAFIAPGGTLNVGDLAGGADARSAANLGVVTVAGGDINAAVRMSVEVNQSRIFTLGRGDVLLWASLGNLDAGRGAKTVVGAPPPVYTINAQGQFVVDTAGSFSGSGIAVLGSGSNLDLYAPLGEINAGDAGIKTLGNAFLGATRLVGADNFAASGKSSGLAVQVDASAAVSAIPQAPAATSAGLKDQKLAEDDEEQRRKRRPRRSIFLDFLGFSQGE
ncbi:filamentous haemagglutinin family protein [Roseateles sp. PN1]|uniref:filamentous haemagglutinin family protein n=1 Tax=Roseateles sp. PN1 TaxID=3137372 RepID=UPI00313A0A21